MKRFCLVTSFFVWACSAVPDVQYVDDTADAAAEGGGSSSGGPGPGPGPGSSSGQSGPSSSSGSAPPECALLQSVPDAPRCCGEVQCVKPNGSSCPSCGVTGKTCDECAGDSTKMCCIKGSELFCVVAGECAGK